jgi:hypothetical protein
VTTTATGGEPGVMGFVLGSVYIAADPEVAGGCPRLSRGAPELFLETLAPAEREQYAAPEKRRELGQLLAARMGFKFAPVNPDPLTGSVGPEQIEAKRKELGIPEGKGSVSFNGRVVHYDTCSDPQDFPQFIAGLQPYVGAVAPGIDLDGRVDADDYTGVDGAPGVDNQLWRALGCHWSFRESGVEPRATHESTSVRSPTLVELRGVDDPYNDEEVEVSVRASRVALQMDGKGAPLAHASYDGESGPALVYRTRGRIVNGVLSTEPFDVGINYMEQVIENVRRLRDARIRARILPDGRIEGGFYGYYELGSFMSFISSMTQQGADVSNMSCPAVNAALASFADGAPDPLTGHPTAISAALGFFGVRAHVVETPVLAIQSP